MYNKEKKCPACHWSRRYDTNRDTFGIWHYMYCPLCGHELETVGYSPNI